jgi:hypothetical protein
MAQSPVNGGRQWTNPHYWRLESAWAALRQTMQQSQTLVLRMKRERQDRNLEQLRRVLLRLTAEARRLESAPLVNAEAVNVLATLIADYYRRLGETERRLAHHL